MRVTIKDIAKELGITDATVSLALNNHSRITAKTKEKVRRMAKELNYIPNAIARGLCSNRTKAIGLIYPYILHDLFFERIYRGVEEAVLNQGYNIFLCGTDGRSNKEQEYLHLLKEKRVDGIIMTPISTDNIHSLQELVDNEIPAIFVDRYLEEIETDYVVTDNIKGGYIATRHLIKLGHKRIGHITHGAEATSVRDRLKGYQKALKEHKLGSNSLLVKCSENSSQAIKELLRMEPRPTAIFCVNDETAIAVLRAIRKEKLKVPEDVAIVGYDGAGLAESSPVPLTTIAQPIYEMGYEAGKILMDKVNGGKGSNEVRKVFLEPKLVIRESSGEKI